MSDTIYHLHHIVPKHAGGTDDPSNIVKLTIEEHAEAHRKLYDEHGRWQDKLAWLGLSGMIGKEEIIKEIQRENGRINGSKSSNSAWLTGRPKSEETKRKISKTLTGRVQSQSTKDKRAESHRGQKRSQEARDNISKSQKGKLLSEDHKRKLAKSAKNRPKVACPHCGKYGDISMMKRWHFDKCKHLPEM